MSMEDAILKLADSLNAVAQSNHALAAAGASSTQAYKASIAAYGKAMDVYSAGVPTSAEELEQAVQKVEAAAKQEVLVKGITPDEAGERGKAKQEAADKLRETEAPNDASGAAEPADTSAGAQSEEETLVLDYKADVKPTLLQVFKAKGADALAGLLKKHLPDAAKPNGDMLKPAQLPAVLADAKALLAG